MGVWDKALGGGNKMARMVKEAPKARPQKMPVEVLELTKTFKKEYAQKDLDQLWGAMMACYGTKELAIQAAYENPQIVNPSYSFTNTMLASRDVLLDIMEKEEAMQVMLRNPAVLQCGPSLDTLGPDEIKGFANIRYWGNKIPENSRLAALAATGLLICAPIVGANVPEWSDSPILQLIKPLVGILFAVAIEGSRIAIVGTIFKAKMSGDERIKKAEENEKRRLSGSKSFGGR